MKARRVREWRGRMGTIDAKRAGAARDRSPFACGCTAHNGMCHGTVKSHRPLVERRANRFATTEWQWLAFDQDARLWIDADMVGLIEDYL